MKRLRTASRLSIFEAATKIGVGTADVEAWESGSQLPSELSADRISKVYGIPKKDWLEMLRSEADGGRGVKF